MSGKPPAGQQVGTSKQTPYYQVSYSTIVIARDLGPSAYVLYTYLSLRLGRNETAWPSYRKITEDTGLTDKTVKRAIDTLVANGLLTVERHAIWQRQHYILHDPKPLADPVRPESSPNHYDPKAVRPTGETPTENSAGSTGENPVVSTGEIPVASTGEIPNEVDTSKVESGKKNQYDGNAARPRPSARKVQRTARDVMAAFIDRRGQGVQERGVAGKQAGIAKRIIGAGYAFEDIVGCMDYLQSGGRTWTMVHLERTLPEWIIDQRPARMNGRPSAYKTTEERTDEAFATLYDRLGYTNGAGGNGIHPDPDEDLATEDYVDVSFRAERTNTQQRGPDEW
jgi:hypothetical protein